jgi:hypothetical protein
MRTWVLVIVAACSSSKPVEHPHAQATWQTLAQALPGSWSGTTDAGSTVEVTFRTISKGSALAETFGSAGRETMTLYHPDHGDIVATHYCGQGNAPRLRVTQASARAVVWKQVDVTDLDRDEASLVETDLALAPDGKSFERVEVYRDANGALERTRWRFVRQ